MIIVTKRETLKNHFNAAIQKVNKNSKTYNTKAEKIDADCFSVNLFSRRFSHTDLFYTVPSVYLFLHRYAGAGSLPSRRRSNVLGDARF